MSIANVAIKFTAIDLMSRGIDRMRNKIHSLSSASLDTQKSFDKMTNRFKLAGFGAVATTALYKGIKPAIGSAANLQEALLGVRAELKGGSKDATDLDKKMDAIKKRAFSIQSWSPFDMTEIVGAERMLLRAGASVKEVTKKRGITTASVSLATVAGVAPTEIAPKLIGIGTPFRTPSTGYNKLADLIVRAESASQAGILELAETAKYAAPKMAQLGRSPLELLSTSAVLAKSGIESSMAGTGLRQFYNRLGNFPALIKANGDLKSLPEIISIIREDLKGLGKTDVSRILNKAFGVRGAPVALALIVEDSAPSSYKNIQKAIASATSLQERLDMRLRGFNAQMGILKGTSSSIVSQLFLPALDPLTSVLRKINKIASSIGVLINKKKEIAELVSGLGVGGVALGGIGTAGLAIGGAVAGLKVLKGVGGLKGLFGGAASTAIGVAKGLVLEKATGVTPVFVTNWPGSALPFGKKPFLLDKPKELIETAVSGASGAGAAGMAATGGGAALASGGLIATAGAVAVTSVVEAGAVAAGVVAAGGAAIGYYLGESLKKFKSIGDWSEKRRDASDRLWGIYVPPELARVPEKFKNRKTTALQEKNFPLMRRKARPIYSPELRRTPKPVIDPHFTAPKIKNQIAINITIDKNGRAIAETVSPSTYVETNVNRGVFVDGR